MDKPRILAVDDEAVVLRVIQRVLGDEYAVDCATNGEEGLSRIRDGSYRLLILDLRMPRCSGTELLRRLRRAGTAPARVLVLSASPGSLKELADAGLKVDLVMQKPFEVEALREAVRRLVPWPAS